MSGELFPRSKERGYKILYHLNLHENDPIKSIRNVNKKSIRAIRAIRVYSFPSTLLKR